MPQISIGLPVYNGSEFLAEAIESLLSQSYTDFELVISDNASTDDTGAICRKYSDKDSRIVYHRNSKNLGCVANHRRVFSLAKGRYFRWASANDYCSTYLLERCCDLLERDSTVVLAHGETAIVDRRGLVLQEYPVHLRLDSLLARSRFASFIDNIGLINQFAGLVRTEILQSCGPMQDYIGSDIVLLARLALRGKVVELPEVLFYRRIGEGVTSWSLSESDLRYFYNPESQSRFVLPALRRTWELMKAIVDSPLDMKEKAWCARYLIRRAISSRSLYTTEISNAWRKVLGRIKGPS